MTIKDMEDKLTTKDVKKIIISLGGEIFSEKDNIIKFKIFYKNRKFSEVLFYYTKVKIFYNYVRDEELNIFNIISRVRNIDLSDSVRYFKKMISTINDYDYKLGDKVEIINVDGLNRVLYNDYPKGNRNLIGLQGMIIMIDDTTDKNITYYVVDLPIKNPRIYDMRYIIDRRTIFLKDNLKLVKESENKVDNSRFFNPSDIKSLNYKDLDGETLKITVVDNEEFLLVAGVDKENNKIYMLHSEVK